MEFYQTAINSCNNLIYFLVWQNYNNIDDRGIIDNWVWLSVGCALLVLLFNTHCSPTKGESQVFHSLTISSNRKALKTKNKTERVWVREVWPKMIWGCFSTLFISFLMRWMKLEPIIQSELSQKDKDHYNILTHIYGI